MQWKCRKLKQDKNQLEQTWKCPDNNELFCWYRWTGQTESGYVVWHTKLHFSNIQHKHNWIWCYSYFVSAVENHKNSCCDKMKVHTPGKQSLPHTQKTSVHLLKATQQCGSLALEEHVDSIMGCVLDKTHTHTQVLLTKICFSRDNDGSYKTVKKKNCLSIQHIVDGNWEISQSQLI